jgi:hypothetical protein
MRTIERVNPFAWSLLTFFSLAVLARLPPARLGQGRLRKWQQPLLLVQLPGERRLRLCAHQRGQVPLLAARPDAQLVDGFGVLTQQGIVLVDGQHVSV